MPDSEPEAISGGDGGALEKGPSTASGFQYPGKKVLIPVVIALYLSVFLVALDRTIIATPLPTITNEFNSLDDVGWYGSAYLLTACAFQLNYGKIYTLYPAKQVFLASIMLFEIGSAVCAGAPNSTAFIVGRAIAGLGSSGIFSGAIVILTGTVPLHKRPMYTGFLGAVFGISSVIGPLLGGALTESATWRWCFIINVPIGAVAIVIIMFILKLPPPAPRTDEKISVLKHLAKLDPIGTTLFLPGMVCLILALQWGGSEYAWNNGRIIALLVLGGVLLISFVGVQIWLGEDATVPPRIAKNRTVYAGMLFTVTVSGSFMVIVYYLPLWFQAIQGVDPVQSGIRNLPTILSLVISSISSGILITKLGYYTPFMYACVVILSVGAGMLTTLQVDTSEGEWIGYQVIYGFGLGLGMQQSMTAAQTALSRRDVSTGVSLMLFAQSFGGAIFISVAQNVLSNRLVQNLTSVVPGLDPRTIVNIGATDLRTVFGTAHLDVVLKAYNESLRGVFTLSLALACACVIGAGLMEWRSVHKEKAADKRAMARATAGSPKSENGTETVQV